MEKDGTQNDDASLQTAVETVGTLNGGGGGGGGLFYPFFGFLIVLSLQALDAFLETTKKKGPNNSEQSHPRQEIKQLLKEASFYSTPSTFAQAAKLTRMAAAEEKELLKKQEEQNKDMKSSHDLYARSLLVLKVLLYVGLCWCFWSVPVAAVPQHLLQPFGRFLSWRAKDSATGLMMVGIIPWLVLTSRVSKFPLPESFKDYCSEIDQRTLRDSNPTRITSMNHKYICCVFFWWSDEGNKKQ